LEPLLTTNVLGVVARAFEARRASLLINNYHNFFYYY
jgi:hypothetical protein